jgi:hypothetical protein
VLMRTGRRAERDQQHQTECVSFQVEAHGRCGERRRILVENVQEAPRAPEVVLCADQRSLNGRLSVSPCFSADLRMIVMTFVYESIDNRQPADQALQSPLRFSLLPLARRNGRHRRFDP